MAYDPGFRRGKIVATLGPASATERTVRELLSAGVDVVRINSAHGTPDSRREMIETVRRVRRTLGKHWSTQVELRPNQTVTNTGIYAYLRHPAYLGVCIEMIGYSVALGSGTALVATFFLFIPTVLVRMLLEDRTLTKDLPGYTAYRESTPALLPFLYKTRYKQDIERNGV